MSWAAYLRLVRREVVFDDWYRIERCTVDQSSLNGGTTRINRYVCRRSDRVAVLPYRHSDGTVLLTRQVRVPALMAGHPEPDLIEVAGGLIDPGESPAAAARRELAEEVGFHARVSAVGVTLLNPVLVAEHTHLFIADLDNAEPSGPGGGVSAEGEAIEWDEFPLAEALVRVRVGEIVDSKTVILLSRLAGATANVGPHRDYGAHET